MFASDLMQESHKFSLPLAKDVGNKRAYEKESGLVCARMPAIWVMRRGNESVTVTRRPNE